MQFTYLALGDSYTIGEGVRLSDNFPYQTLQLLRGKGLDFHAPEIIATTGWTTDELDAAIAATVLQDKYDVVSLLIGVNNQYRGRSVENYAIEFEALLKKAIGFSGNNNSRVFVISIPDWGITPFAKDRDSAVIATEINAYNAAAKNICVQNNIAFIDITTSQRHDNSLPGFIAADGLHPSGKEYAKWAAQLSTLITGQIK